jgi:O-antigen/teichoic acid export membrane protein
VSATEHHEEQLSAPEVRRRALSGAVVDTIRAFGIRALSFVGAAILARQLTPSDFGAVAVGQTFLTVGTFLADGGIAAALIRRHEPPSRADLKAFLGLQLALTTVLVVLIGAAMLPLGEIGVITAVMVLSLPVTVLCVPGSILLERQLNYRTPAAVDLVSTIAYYAWALPTVMLGWGVWALASGGIVRTLVGTAFFLGVFPAGRMLPSPSWKRVRPLLGFGFRYQAATLVVLARDQGINLAVAVVGGVSELGLYNIAYRIIQIPFLLFNSLWRVSFPSMSRLVTSRGDMRATIERVLGVVSVAAGLLLAPLAASAQDLVPALFGDQWTGAAPVIPPVCLTFMFAGPVSVALVGYLWAVGDARAVLRSIWLGLPFLFALLLALLPVIGVAAAGYCSIPAGIVELAVLVRAARKRVAFAVLPRVGPPTAFAILGAIAGWLCCWSIDSHLIGAVCGSSAAAFLYLVGLSIWHRSYLADTVNLGLQGMRGALR